MAGRGRLSSIDLLPDEAQDDIVWACQQLYSRTRSQEDIRFELNDRLEAKGLEPISRSAFNRKAMRLAAAQRRMQDARAMFEGLSEQFTAEDVDQNTVIIGEFIKTLIVELVGDESGEKTPKEAMELARAFQATVAAQKISTERRQKIEADFAAKAGKAIEEVAKAKGLTADTVEAIRSKVLGVDP
jgi:Skp family chaperone for outer membrane proteins